MNLYCFRVVYYIQKRKLLFYCKKCDNDWFISNVAAS